nr:MAG: DNA pilot protein [Microvirus sp.]
MVWGAIIDAGANLLGGKMADKGQKDANRSNERIAKDNRDFQERMSNSAYQRSAKDLTAAGLNRILALGSPASSPSGATATMHSETAGKADSLKKGTASALQARIAQQQFKLLQSQTDQVGATTNKTNLESDNVSAHNAKLRAEESIYERFPQMRFIQMLAPFLGGGALGAAAGYVGGRVPSKKRKLPNSKSTVTWSKDKRSNKDKALLREQLNRYDR